METKKTKMPDCLRSDIIDKKNIYTLLVTKENGPVKIGDLFYYGIAGKHYEVTGIVETKQSILPTREVYKVTAKIHID